MNFNPLEKSIVIIATVSVFAIAITSFAGASSKKVASDVEDMGSARVERLEASLGQAIN